MKCSVLSLLVICSIFCFGQEEQPEHHHTNFIESSLTIGAAIPVIIHQTTPGINLRMYYNHGEKFCFGPEYAYFKTAEFETVDFDFIGHYIFETKWVGIYPLIGANYTVEKALHADETKAAVGLVFGAGMHRNFKNITLFAEYSQVELGINDQFFSLGLMHTFK